MVTHLDAEDAISFKGRSWSSINMDIIILRSAEHALKNLLGRILGFLGEFKGQPKRWSVPKLFRSDWVRAVSHQVLLHNYHRV